MLRHTALFLHRDTISEDQKLAMLRGLAFLRMECAGVRAGDYGQDLFGGSGPLLAVPPWKRTPRWRARREGPPCNYDAALHLDFDDERGRAEYLTDDVHRTVAAFNASVNVPELTARIDWRYDGGPRVHRGMIRHTAMFVWEDGAPENGRARALQAARELAESPGVLSLAVGENVGTVAANFDWIVDVELPDLAAARDLVGGSLYAEAMAAVAPVTKYEWTARITHVMRGY